MVELLFGECSTTRQTLMRYAAGAVEPVSVEVSAWPSTITNTASVTGIGPVAKSVRQNKSEVNGCGEGMLAWFALSFVPSFALKIAMFQ